MAFFPTRQIALQLGPLALHWYGLMYLLAFLFAWITIPRLSQWRRFSLTADQLGNLLTYGILGTLLGGRLGYVLFYGAEYYSLHPWEIFAIWKGGMSSHGGFIGVIVSLLFFSRKEHIDFWKLADVIVVPVAIGLALGRFGNFINQELYGPVTTLPWGISIPGVEGLRHPTPLYAMAKDLCIAGVCFLHLKFSSSEPRVRHGELACPSEAPVERRRVEPRSTRGELRSRFKTPGTTTALFLILYGILRFLIEYLRIETASGFAFGSIYLTRGQLLTIPLIILGALIMCRLCLQHRSSSAPVLGSE